MLGAKTTRTLARRSIMEALPQGKERRLVLRLLNYWRDLGRDESFPALGDLDPDAMGDMWPFCFVLRVDAAVTASALTYIGPEILADCDEAPAEPTLETLPDATLIKHATAFVGQTLRRKVPITKGGEFIDHRGRAIQFRSIVLPLAEDGRTVDHLLGAANCRELPKD